MSTFNQFSVALLAAVALFGGIAQADSELDGKAVNAPQVIVRRLDPVTQTVTNYQVTVADPTLSPAALEVLPGPQRQARIEAFLASAAVPANKVSEERVTRVQNSELDNDSSTGATRWRWRGYGGGYYGGYYRGYYGRGYVSYRPYWGYGRGYYGGYYGGGYYGGYCRGGYGWYNAGYYCDQPYYTVYSYDGCW